MGRQKHTTEQIISKLREAEVLQGKGMPMEEVLRQLGISDATYYRLYLSKKCLPMPAMHRSEPWKP